MITQKHSRSENGQSLVELALVFTLLLLLVGGIIDLGRMFYTSVALRDTVQEGAIFSATHPLEPTAISNRITNSASFPIEASQITDIQITCSGSACTTNTDSCAGKEITVRVGYNYHVIMPVLPIFLGGRTDVPLSASVTGTILQSDTKNCPQPVISPTVTPTPLGYP